MRLAAYVISLALHFGLLCGVGIAPAQIAVESPMTRDPEVRMSPEEMEFPPGLVDLWIECLARPEADLRREAAESIALAHRLGMRDLEAAIAPLSARVGAAHESPLARLAAARALVQIDAKSEAELLSKRVAIDGLPMSLVVEPALSRWGYEPIRAEWRRRVGDSSALPTLRKLAIEGLAAAGDREAATAIADIVRDANADVRLRLAGARALAKIGGAKPLETAKSLVERDTALDQHAALFAAQSLSQASLQDNGEETQAILLRLAAHTEPAAAAIAWRRLLDIDPELTASLMEGAARLRDARLRLLAAEAMHRRPNALRVAWLAPLLDDPHPGVRAYVRESLFELASAEGDLRETVLLEASKVLDAIHVVRWRGHEQAALLFGALDYEPAADRLVALLESPRSEVFVSAAWALRKLAVPETFPKMLDKAERETTKSRSRGMTDPAADRLLSQIFQTFGVERFAPAESLMRQYIPKNRALGDTGRAASVWSLGWLHVDAPDSELAAQLAERLADDNPTNPESLTVRGMSAVSLGRMAAAEQLPVLRTFLTKTGPNSEIGFLCAWSLNRLTGEPMPVNQPIVKHHLGFFLAPEPRLK